MNRADHNINKDMTDPELIDVDVMDFSDDQTWLYKVPDDSGEKIDIVDWSVSLDWPVYDDEEYLKTERDLYAMLDEILKSQVLAMPDKHKFDSRTYVKPKKRMQRPSINSVMEPSNPSILPSATTNQSANKYMTYNKYSSPLGPILRLKTFNVHGNTENSSIIKEYAMKRKSLLQDDDPQLDDIDITLTSETSERLSDQPPTKPINIDLSQPAHNLHNTFNKGLTGLNVLTDRGSLNMYNSGESLMRMSPPSLVSSILMESSGNFNQESLDGRKSLSSQRDSGIPTSGRDSIDQMMTSMTLSILDEKDMSTSFLSQTTYPDHDSLMDSLPPSLVNSVNSSYIVSTPHKPRSESISSENNVFSSATFTHLEQSERLLSARPRCNQLYNSFTKRDTMIINSESYTKSREEACQIDTAKVLNENTDNKDSPKPSAMTETITLHFSNNKFKNNDAEKENVNASFEKSDAFYKDMGMQKTVDGGKGSLNVTLDKQELNEIIQARQKLSLARKALPTEPERPLPNQVDLSPVKNLSNQTMSLPRKSINNASELLARRRECANGFDKTEEPVREPPKRNATFKKSSPKTSLDTTVVFLKEDQKPIIDINAATLNLLDDSTMQQKEWGSQERAMVGSSDSTDTGTFSSSSPPESVPDNPPSHDPRLHVASTPLTTTHKSSKSDLLNLHTTISPIYNMVDEKSYTVTKVPSTNVSDPNTTVINTATLIKKSAAKRDILANRMSPEKKFPIPLVRVKSPVKMLSTGSYNSMAPPTAVRKSSLPASKLRQYSSHKELRLPANALTAPSGLPGPQGPRAGAGRAMVRRSVYASNPVLSPTSTAPSFCPPVNQPPPIRRDSYTIMLDQPTRPTTEPVRSTLANPPTLVRQGTETLRRDRPKSQLIPPKDPPAQRPNPSVAGPQRVSRPSSGSVMPKNNSVPLASEARPSSCDQPRTSALPRPSRLPAPRRTLRPPSVYSVAPTADDHY
ncbi:uncharacterized protein LOC113238256 isoform X2 [Hyposmocoma kahamanoa]|uniref:uncharacterized protein LOC113238256 isoform X2 n=1 Tax=Hyposmocoma kahamanoa TaxID=1477025 RepID=UPI000E6D8245|nr:uncharacterized protein LOC113238256 isoform X2 [Hyposmocoma kahamanoa]